MSSIRESIEVTSSREYAVLGFVHKKVHKKNEVKSYTEKRLSFSESTSIKKAPDNACVSLLVSSPESFVSCSSMFISLSFYLKAVALRVLLEDCTA